ncbi:SDR family NAD(P)-dependent oxidoreductase [Dactylosporangium aurantiacum]|uniref:SDR family NAD(P)-dependent oxidoreductase n=1 Tax=Dactylosporangium aurantiacum TaxID=35754 RepID=A0A9Q9MQB1_9ACTN|nr:SDR family NAD(P)-dependent oxidoreductase [Dactylosporangium aurantiacum]MDG6107823.1 SDR family NAD(P)-dependent oxidoreductase [Dactylosporangium aurantiacum]UWZ57402.1 SDR family NAD(P)-dependent oxidoreductase [Dactylosporangium aurantiacum]
MGVVVVSGGTNGMGRAFALGRAERGDTVVVVGRSRARGEAMAGGAVTFLPADLSGVAENRRVVAEILAEHPVVDALALFANAVSTRREVTAEGLERTFALYYLSRYLLSFGLRPALDRAARPVIVNVAGVGVTRGAVRWTDPQLSTGYSAVRAQLQAGRANDLLGAGFAARSGSRARYVLFHPGFARSGDRSGLPVVVRGLLAVASLAARPIAEAVAPIHGFVDGPPAAALTAVDRDRVLPPDFPTLDAGAAARLMDLTERLLAEREGQ